jgi:hypothetical protein
MNINIENRLNKWEEVHAINVVEMVQPLLVCFNHVNKNKIK